MDFSSELKELLKNKSYLLLVISFTILFGFVGGVGNILSPLFEPYNYTTGEITLLGSGFVLAGTIGAIVVGLILDKTRKYLLLLRVVCWASCIGSFTLIYTMAASFILCLINLTLLGAFMIPVLVIGYSFAVELTHPISPALVNGFMISCG